MAKTKKRGKKSKDYTQDLLAIRDKKYPKVKRNEKAVFVPPGLKKLKSSYRKLKSYNAKALGLPQWAHKSLSIKEDWKKFHHLEEQGLVKRLPATIYLYDCDPSKSRKEALIWSKIHRLMKEGLSKHEAIRVIEAQETAKSFLKQNPKGKIKGRRYLYPTMKQGPIR